MPEVGSEGPEKRRVTIEISIDLDVWTDTRDLPRWIRQALKADLPDWALQNLKVRVVNKGIERES